MFKTIALALVILPTILLGSASGQTQGAAGAKPSKLEMKLSFIDLEEAKFGNRKEIQIVVEIRNVGERTVLIPKGIHGATAFMTGSAMVSFDSDVFMTTRDGFRIPPAPSELAIVELRPKEAIMLHSTLAKPAPGGVSVSYKLSKEFAERYGTWCGELHGSLQLK